MSNGTTIKVNGMTIKIQNKSTESVFDIDKETKTLESLANDINKSIEAFSIISNVKAMEAFGYQTTEGFGDKIKTGAKVIWEKIKQFFISIGKFIANIFKAISNISIDMQFKKIKNKYNGSDPHKIIEKYVSAIINNDNSDKGKRLQQAMLASKIFGEDFGKPFDPVQEAADIVGQCMSYSNSTKINMMDGFDQAHTKLSLISSNIDKFIKNDVGMGIWYNTDNILHAAINESSCQIIDANVNKRLSELSTINDKIVKNIELYHQTSIKL